MEERSSIGGAIVCYNTPDIIGKAVKSIQPYIGSVLIVDASDSTNAAYKECNDLARDFDNVRVLHAYENIGHGPGLDRAIINLPCEYIIGMDSDAVLLDSSLIMEMREKIVDESVYGVGRVLPFAIPYLYLPFFMIKKSMYFQFPKFINSGAPGTEIMKAIHHKKALINIPNLMDRIYHKGRATREIAGHWRAKFGGKVGV